MKITEPTISPREIMIIGDNDFNLGNVCIVTGCGTGIGRATAIAAAVNGLTVVGLDINDEEALKTQAMVERLGRNMVFLQTDLCSDADMEDAISVASKLGTIKYLANIAGLQHIDSVENFPMERYDLMQRVMLRAPFFLSQLVIPHFQKSDNGRGVIGHMASIHAHICTRNKASYNIAKFGLLALAQSISAEGDGKIRSFTVSTGFVQTPLAMNQVSAQAVQRGITEDEVVKDVMLGSSRVKEMMTPAEVANQFMYGFSRFSKYLVGGDILMDGGVVKTY
jgi:3-hydroxybutyrate dehydrogenase